MRNRHLRISLGLLQVFFLCGAVFLGLRALVLSSVRDGLYAAAGLFLVFIIRKERRLLDPRKAIERGLLLFFAKKYRESIESFDAAIKLDPSFAETYLLRGKSYIALALDRQGIQDLDRYIELDPHGTEIAYVYALRGSIYGRNGNFEAAERDLKIAAEKGSEAAEKMLREIARDKDFNRFEEIRKNTEEQEASFRAKEEENIGRKNLGSKDEDRFAEVLELTGEFGVDEIKRNYKKLAAQYHPDRVNHLGERLKTAAEKEMKDINEAYGYFRKKLGF